MTNADLHALDEASHILEHNAPTGYAFALERCRKERALLLKAARDVIARAKDKRVVTLQCGPMLALRRLAASCGEPKPAKEQK